MHHATSPDGVYVYGSDERSLRHVVTSSDPDIDECTSTVTVNPSPSGSVAVEVNDGRCADVNQDVDPEVDVNWYDSGATNTGADAAFGLVSYVYVMYGSADVSDDANFFHP